MLTSPFWGLSFIEKLPIISFKHIFRTLTPAKVMWERHILLGKVSFQFIYSWLCSPDNNTGLLAPSISWTVDTIREAHFIPVLHSRHHPEHRYFSQLSEAAMATKAILPFPFVIDEEWQSFANSFAVLVVKRSCCKSPHLVHNQAYFKYV